jgi:hypothetical protein
MVYFNPVGSGCNLISIPYNLARKYPYNFTLNKNMNGFSGINLNEPLRQIHLFQLLAP